MNRAEWLKILEIVARRMFAGEIAVGDIVPEMVLMHGIYVMKGVQEGFGQSLDDEGISAKDLKLLERLQKNVFHFSGAKNFHQLREMSAMLTDDKGEIVSFDEFLKAVKTVDETYNVAYLEAEYNHAQSTSLMIGKWQDFQKEKNDLPYLKYSAVMDERTRPEHAALNDVVKKVDDPFWDKWFPPNGWNCRCDVVQMASADETDVSTIETPPQEPFFANNPGKAGVVFSGKHPYFTDLPKEYRDKVKSESEGLI